MLHRTIISIAFCLSTLIATAQTYAWGDLGNGYYKNPILPIDYSDPDAIRVGDAYYMVASDFHFMGMQVLKSYDLVNWKIISQIYSRLDFPGWNENKHYAGGSWAPAIRYHDGKFWVFFCTPDEGLFMTFAENPDGPWAPLHLVKGVKKWEDPCPFWDEDGQAYLGRSQHGAGPIIVHRMSPDGKQLLDDGVEVYRGPVAEGTKFYKLNGYYYLCIPEGGVGQGWQTCLRSKNIYGPYERRIVLEQGSTKTNGPHQGAMVDTPEGEWWFLHFQEKSPLGRVVHLQPMHWEENWPVMGHDVDGNGIGEPVDECKMPKGKRIDQSFAKIEGFGLHWQWNHNPVNDRWSISPDKQSLTLTALKANDFKQARNTFTQKIIGYKRHAEVMLDLSQMQEGQRCGLSCMGKQNMLIGIMKRGGALYLYEEHDELTVAMQPYNSQRVLLALDYDTERNEFCLSYAAKQGKPLRSIATTFAMRNGFWKGARVALFNYNTQEDGGSVTFSNFTYTNVFSDINRKYGEKLSFVPQND